jgi:dCTP deaminase
MGVLVDWQLRKLFEEGMVKPAKYELINPASFDVRIGNTLILQDGTTVDISGATEESPYWIKPKEFILVDSLEVFDLPRYVSGRVALKSSRAREGWNHCLAGYLDPKWNGSVLTMELINEKGFRLLPYLKYLWQRLFNPHAVDPNWLPLYPGLRMVQIVLDRLDAEPLRDYSQTGRYNGDTQVQGSKG